MLGAIVGGAGGALGGLLGGLGKNAAIRSQLRAIAQAEKSNQNWYDRNYNEDVTQRADAQRLLTMTEEAMRKRNRAAAGRAAVMGGTDESVAAEKAAGAKAMSDAVSQINAAGEARKQQVDAQYQTRKNQLADARANLEGQRSNVLLDATVGALGGLEKGLTAGLAQPNKDQA